MSTENKDHIKPDQAETDEVTNPVAEAMSKLDQDGDSQSETGERIAKVIARSGLCSRREAERWIEQGRVQVNDATLETAATVVTKRDSITVDGQPLPVPDRIRVWKMHKPIGTLVSDFDPFGRKLLKDMFPADMPRVNAVGRLDYNSEGLILLTTDGALKRTLELPETGLPRTYKVRVYGTLKPKALAALEKGIEIEGVVYGSIKVEVQEQKAANSWIIMTLHEGKNREVRKVCEHLGLQVNRLIRTSYGRVKLANLGPGKLVEMGQKEIYEAFGIGKKPKASWAKAKQKPKKPTTLKLKSLKLKGLKKSPQPKSAKPKPAKPKSV